MQIAAAAYPLDWHNRWNDYVGKLRVWVRTAAENGAAVLVFPDFAALEIASLAGEENARDPARVVEALTARRKDVDALHDSLAREFALHLCAATGPLRVEGKVVNRARLFAPDGRHGAQDQLTPAQGDWDLTPGAAARVFETALGRVGILIGSDLAAPGLAAAMADAGAVLLLAPCRAATAEAAAELRAQAQARASETGCAVALAVALNDGVQAPALGPATGAAAILAPDGEGGALGKTAAAGWVQAEVALPAASPPAPSADASGWAIEVAALEAAARES